MPAEFTSGSEIVAVTRSNLEGPLEGIVSGARGSAVQIRRKAQDQGDGYPQRRNKDPGSGEGSLFLPSTERRALLPSLFEDDYVSLLHNSPPDIRQLILGWNDWQN